MDSTTAPGVIGQAQQRAQGSGEHTVELIDRKVLICGAGLAGASAARAALARGAHVLIADRARPTVIEELIAEGATFLGDVAVVPEAVSLVVVSPGIPPANALIRSALQSKVAVVGEVEFAWRLRGANAAPWLAVTGTNGKTTTVRMVESILSAAGLRALAVGNVGVSIIDAVTAAQPYEVLAVELSSYQLHWSSTLAPAAAALLNIAPDHLDWHGGLTEYADAKRKIWNTPIAVGNLDDPWVAGLLARLDTAHRRVGFTLRSPQDGQIGVEDGAIVDRALDASRPGCRIIGTDEIRPAGPHNVANAAAAAALARSYGIAAEAVAEGLRRFVPDPHRNQRLGERSGIVFVDDSKATNPHAAAASLAAYDSVVWVAGGQLKGASVEDLVRAFARKMRAVVVLGADRELFVAALSRHAPDVPVIVVASTDHKAMEHAVGSALDYARPGDTVLLAPAAASYDMFSGYAARGDAFAAAIAGRGALQT